jgi:hypothetical protein
MHAMATNDDKDDDDNSTALTLAVVGGGAVLLWLLLRGRGKGSGGSSHGTGDTGGTGANDSRDPPARRVVRVRVLAGDRIKLDDVSADLDATVARARIAGIAEFQASSDAREGWVSKVLYALRDAGVLVEGDPDTMNHTPRFDSSGRVVGVIGINEESATEALARAAQAKRNADRSCHSPTVRIDRRR